MAIYRNERVPPWEFVNKLKRIDENLFVVFDSISMRWDILYKNPEVNQHFHVYRVCQRDADGVDIAYEALDERVIWKLRKMDMKRRNIAAKEYVKRVQQADAEREVKDEQENDAVHDYIIKHENHTIGRMFDALRGVYRSH